MDDVLPGANRISTCMGCSSRVHQTSTKAGRQTNVALSQVENRRAINVTDVASPRVSNPHSGEHPPMSLETSRPRSVFGGYPIDTALAWRKSQRNEPQIAMAPVTGTGDIGTPFGNILEPCLDQQRRPTSQKPRPGSGFSALGAIFCSHDQTMVSSTT